MSLTDLVSLLNEATRTGSALVAENENDLIVPEIHADLTLQMMRLAEAASLAYTTYDSEFSECEDEDIKGDPGLFCITLKRPSRTAEELDNTLYILTEVGFIDFLCKGHAAEEWRISGLTAPFTCQAHVFSDWNEPLSLPHPLRQNHRGCL